MPVKFLQEDMQGEAKLLRWVHHVRDARNQMDVEQSRRIPVIMAAGSQTAMLKAQAPLIQFLARTEPPQLLVQLAQKPEQSMSLLAGPVEIYLPLAGMLDIGKELERLNKEIALAQQEITRIQGKLANESFVTRAKPEVVEKEREKLSAQEERIGKLLARRGELGDRASYSNCRSTPGHRADPGRACPALGCFPGTSCS